MKNYRKEEEFVMDFEKIFESYGYEKIRLNTFEKYDIYFLNKDIISESNLLKLINPKGDIYVLRPDMTLPVVKYFSEQEHTRGKYYYSDSVFRGDRNGLEFNERKQLGIEYLGGENILSDIEILDLAVQTLERLDEDYMICISNTEFIKEMVDFAIEDEVARVKILDFIYRRSSNLENYLKGQGIEAENIKNLLSLNNLFGNFEIEKENLYQMAVTEKQKQILQDLEIVLKTLNKKYPENKINVDFSISVALQYYNGLIFRGYVSGIKKPILTGGRYDKLVTRFGKEASALGFCVEIDNYFESIKKDGIKIDYLFLYSDFEGGLKAMDEATNYRSYGKTVRILPEDKGELTKDHRKKYSEVKYF